MHVPGPCSHSSLHPRCHRAFCSLWNSCSSQQNSALKSLGPDSFSGLNLPESPSPHSPWATSPLCDTYLVSLYLIYISVPSWTGSASKTACYSQLCPQCAVRVCSWQIRSRLLCYASNHSRTGPKSHLGLQLLAGVSQRVVLGEARVGGEKPGCLFFMLDLKQCLS